MHYGVNEESVTGDLRLLRYLHMELLDDFSARIRFSKSNGGVPRWKVKGACTPRSVTVPGQDQEQPEKLRMKREQT